MMNRNFLIGLSQKYWSDHLSQGDLVIDATCGNGHDTYFLSELTDRVYGLDIQEAAITKTKNRLQNNVSRVTLLLRSHVDLDKIPLPFPPRLIVFNLGYLPRSDKVIKTKTTTTLKSVRMSLELLGEGGALSIMCYPGHEEGLIEERDLLAFFKTLDPKQWLVCHHRLANREKAPSLFWIKSIK